VNGTVSIGVVVPVLNESTRLKALVDKLHKLAFEQIVIVDGGSDDGSWELARTLTARHSEVSAIRTMRGRAYQMNAGARQCTMDVLLFLHADTVLPAGAAGAIRDAVSRGELWGRFDVRFDDAGLLLAMVARAMNLPSALTGICTGDQGIFIDRKTFIAIKGYAELPLMEDIELSARLKRRQHPCRLRTPVTTSARRWRRQGVLVTVLRMWMLRVLYWLGVPARALARRYYAAS